MRAPPPDSRALLAGEPCVTQSHRPYILPPEPSLGGFPAGARPRAKRARGASPD